MYAYPTPDWALAICGQITLSVNPRETIYHKQEKRLLDY